MTRPAGRPAAKTKGVTLTVRIQPRASKNDITRMEDGGIKIRLTAPPVDGAANEALVRYLADVFSVARAEVEIVSGQTSKNKIVKISRISPDAVNQLLSEKKK